MRGAFGARFEVASLLATLRELGGSGWAVWAFALAYLVGTSFLVPAVAFHVVAGAALGFERAVLINFALANLVSNLHFAVGRLAGTARVEPWLRARGFGRVADAFRDGGVIAMATARQLPLPFVGVNVAAGALPLRWRDFAFGSGLGLVPQVGVYTWFAAAIADGVDGAKGGAFWRALGAGLALVAVLLGSRWLAARRRASGA